jgi:hypothetical protein
MLSVIVLSVVMLNVVAPSDIYARKARASVLGMPFQQSIMFASKMDERVSQNSV